MFLNVLGITGILISFMSSSPYLSVERFEKKISKLVNKLKQLFSFAKFVH